MLVLQGPSGVATAARAAAPPRELPQETSQSFIQWLEYVSAAVFLSLMRGAYGHLRGYPAH
eukprot:8324366-Pyramimonas_sp.AAC.1